MFDNDPNSPTRPTPAQELKNLSTLFGSPETPPLLHQVDTLRDILGCSCSFNETYDGKTYNLKTEKYEDCECIEKIQSLLTYFQDLMDEVIGANGQYVATDDLINDLDVSFKIQDRVKKLQRQRLTNLTKTGGMK